VKPLLERVHDGPVVVADGAMGSLLMSRGLEPGASPEGLNLSSPDTLRDVAAAYFEAGAELVQTNTFGGSALKLALYGLDDRTEEINRRAVEAVRSVVTDRAYVSGSCGPCGRMLEPYGDVTETEMHEGFARQASAMAEAGVDVICVETMTDVREAAIAISAAREAAPGTPVMATMTFDPTPRGFYTIMGVDIPSAVSGLLQAGADIVGSNCGNGSGNMVDIAREFREHTDAPMLIQPNAGMPETVDGEVVYRETPEFMAERAVELVALGVNIVGGCCGTTPAHIRALASALRAG